MRGNCIRCKETAITYQFSKLLIIMMITAAQNQTTKGLFKRIISEGSRNNRDLMVNKIIISE